VFSCDDGDDGAVWHKVGGSETLRLDPIGAVVFRHGVQRPEVERSPGEAVIVQPALFTGDGLLINSCHRGEHEGRYGGPSAAVRLLDGAGQRLADASSGFA
jgi:hypothetical protein